MLVLSRRKNESIHLVLDAMTDEQLIALRGQKLVITCVEVRGDKTRLGFTVPKTVSVLREEILPASPVKEPA